MSTLTQADDRPVDFVAFFERATSQLNAEAGSPSLTAADQTRSGYVAKVLVRLQSLCRPDGASAPVDVTDVSAQFVSLWNLLRHFTETLTDKELLTGDWYRQFVQPRTSVTCAPFGERCIHLVVFGLGVSFLELLARHSTTAQDSFRLTWPTNHQAAGRTGFYLLLREEFWERRRNDSGGSDHNPADSYRNGPPTQPLFSEDDIRKAAEEISRLPWFVADTTQSGAGLKTPRRRKRTGGQQQQPLTEKQMEAVKLHGDCEGNISEVGRRLGIDRKSAEQRIKSGFAKIGKTVPKKAKTQKLKRGNRGEDDVAEEDDKRR